MTYLLNLSLVVLYYIFIKSNYSSNKGRIYFYKIILIHILLFRVLAEPDNYVDIDLYKEAFGEIPKMEFTEAILSVNYYTHWGPGFLLLNWIIGQISDNFQLFYAIIGILTIFPVVFFYNRTSYDFFISMMIFLIYPMMFYMEFGVLRQHLSVAFTLLALYYFDKKIISVPIAIISCFMHTSGIVFLPFFLWDKLDFANMRKYSIIFYMILFLLVSRFMMGSILSLMPKYEEIAGDGTENNYTPAIWMGFSVLFCLIFGIPKIIKQRRIDNRKDKLCLSYLFYGTAIALFSIGINGMGRLSLCFIYVMPVITTVILHYIKLKSVKWCYIFISLLVIIRQLYYSLINDKYEYSLYF